MDVNPDSLLAIAVCGVDAMPAVVLDGVVGHLDALGALEQDADLGSKV